MGVPVSDTDKDFDLTRRALRRLRWAQCSYEVLRRNLENVPPLHGSDPPRDYVALQGGLRWREVSTWLTRNGLHRLANVCYWLQLGRDGEGVEDPEDARYWTISPRKITDRLAAAIEESWCGSADSEELGPVFHVCKQLDVSVETFMESAIASWPHGLSESAKSARKCLREVGISIPLRGSLWSTEGFEPEFVRLFTVAESNAYRADEGLSEDEDAALMAFHETMADTMTDTLGRLFSRNSGRNSGEG